MEGTDRPPPEEVIDQMATGYMISQAIRTMAVLGLADHLCAGPRTVDELAGESGAHARSLDRLLGPCPPSVCVSATTRTWSV